MRQTPDGGVPGRAYGPRMTAAVFDLNSRATYVHWHFIQISVANLAVIIAMLIVFVLAIVAPFPGSRERRRQS